MQINPTSTYIIYAAYPFAKEMKQSLHLSRRLREGGEARS